MNHSTMADIINEIWELRASLTAENSRYELFRSAVVRTLAMLDQGKVSVVSQDHSSGGWVTNEWVKKAILLSFRFLPMQKYTQGAMHYYDKIPPKFGNDNIHIDGIHIDGAENINHANNIEESGVRIVPGAYIRYGAYIEPSAIVMPSFINVGAYVGAATMIDAWSTVGSCAYVGKNCHISGGVGIGGVLEPIQASPVIIEDDCFIGARSEIAEGVIVERGSVISMGVFLGASTKILNRATGAISYGRVPAYSVVVPGCMPSQGSSSALLACAVIVKTVDEKTRSKTSINELLRDA